MNSHTPDQNSSPATADLPAPTGVVCSDFVRRPIADRIRSAWKPRIGYHELMLAVFPVEQYPMAWRYSHNGGPPICAMAFGKALRKLGLMRYDNTISGTPNTSVSGPCPPDGQHQQNQRGGG